MGSSLSRKLDEKFFTWLSRHTTIKISKKEKFYLLNFMRAISMAGQDEKKALYTKLKEYEKRNYVPGIIVMKKVVSYVESGKSIVDALYAGGILTDREYHILKNSKDGLAKGIERILDSQKKSEKSKMAIFFFFFPPAAILVLLYSTHGLVLGVLNAMFEPMKRAGATPPPIPYYLKDPTVYLIANIAFFSILAAIFAFFWYMKKYRPKKYLSLVPIFEEEYSLDIIRSLKTVMSGGGLNLANAAKALAMGEPDPIKRAIFETVYKSITTGKLALHQILEDYSVNYNTVAAVKIGEDANNPQLGLEIALEDIEKRYNRDIKIFMQAGIWGGQFLMMLIAGKPMIDIMILLSVGQLNFKVY